MIRLILALILAAGPASAARQCADHAAVVKVLADRYGETPRAMGLAVSGELMELFGNEASGTWTLTATTGTGLTCMVVGGSSFEAIPAIPPGVPG